MCGCVLLVVMWSVWVCVTSSDVEFVWVCVTSSDVECVGVCY